MTPSNQLQEKDMSDYQKLFRSSMKKRGHRITMQRLSIVEAFYAMREHLTIYELYNTLKKELPSLGLATVYRTVKLLKDVGLAMELHSGEGSVRFEAVKTPKQHDHFVCRKCGIVMEISCPELEKIQSELAYKYGFLPEAQAHCIYGLCSACDYDQHRDIENPALCESFEGYPNVTA